MFEIMVYGFNKCDGEKNLEILERNLLLEILERNLLLEILERFSPRE